jgi:RimJ/RimL family protein N-acetyltransferase
MNIITSHNITLYGGTSEHRIILRPLTDEHLPFLYKWNADSEVLYWTEGGEDIPRSYDADMVHKIYGGVSKNALCFLIETDGVPIGECWLQKMNLPEVTAMYSDEPDVRRIDFAIGDKSWWNKGIGTCFVRMLVDFAFNGENVDVLHCFCEDYNIRSRRVWEKNGFTFIHSEPLQQPQKGKFQYHWRLTREDYIQNRRTSIPQEQIFELPLKELQPTQLYISEGKLNLIKTWFNKSDKSSMDPIPIKRFNDKIIITDGHTRAILALKSKWDTIPVYWDTDELDMEAYAIDVRWCEEEGVHSPYDLIGRIVPHRNYEELWRKRCLEMRRRTAHTAAEITRGRHLS